MENNTCKISRWQILKSHLNNLTPVEFKDLVEKMPEAIVLDVRTAAEYEQGVLFEAINISYLLGDLWDHLEQLDPEKTYFVYCRSGRRSIRVCTLMKNGGFPNVYNLDGGLNAWGEAFERAETP